MLRSDETSDIVRVVAGLALVVLAAIALIVGVGYAAAKVAPDLGGDTIVEADDDVRTYPDAQALLTAIDCTETVPFAAFEGISARIRSYAQPTGAQCTTDGTIALVYVDRDDRHVAEQDDDVRDRVCATVQVVNTTATTAAAPAADPNAPPPTTVPPTTAPATTTTLPEVTFGLVRGPNWILVSPAGKETAKSLQERLGGEVFTKSCEPETS
jgi:hypothetical protein